jgi:putative restriction endonuclease
MNGFVATTDFDWYSFLKSTPSVEEVNFWQPHGGQEFHAISPGEPLFFKLKKPYYAIAGYGIFARRVKIPAWLAWESFGPGNGAPDAVTMFRRIEKYRDINQQDNSGSYEIGCILLTSPVFFPEEQWISQPADWKRQVVQGKTYSLNEGEGLRIWNACKAQTRIETEPKLVAEEAARYGAPTLIEPRLGQGIFRVGVLDAYKGACAISNEHSLPALEAAHIRPYGTGGVHRISNGILMRSDFHRLFDRGYLTVTPDHTIKVSKRLKQDFSNGKTYYPYDGKQISIPVNVPDQPNEEFLSWHNQNKFLT